MTRAGRANTVMRESLDLNQSLNLACIFFLNTESCSVTANNNVKNMQSYISSFSRCFKEKKTKNDEMFQTSIRIMVAEKKSGSIRVNQLKSTDNDSLGDKEV